MKPETFVQRPFLTSVLHPTDFSEASGAAFAHALAIALRRETSFTLLHAGDESSTDSWSQFPPVRETLERWGLLAPGSDRVDVFAQLHIRVRKHLVHGGNILSAAADYLERHATDLIVLATERRRGLARWLQPSVAERLARRSATRTLFVPQGVPGFVDAATGEMRLRRVLVPVDRQPDSSVARLEAARFATGLSTAPVEVITLHVGDTDLPDLGDPPGGSRGRWTHVHRQGDVVDTIIEEASRDVDLVVMATAGHDGILDVLRGSVTEQVLHGTPCPLLAIPA